MKKSIRPLGFTRGRRTGHLGPEKEIAGKTNRIAADGKLTRFEKFRNRFLRFLDRIFPYKKPVVILYVLVTCGIACLTVHEYRS